MRFYKIRTRTALCIFSITLTIVLTNNISAQEIDVFISPEMDYISSPNYPTRAMNTSSEGAVSLNFMIDKQGQPFEIVVQSVIGHSDFEQAAFNAIKNSHFTPASLNGETVESSMSFQLKFILDPTVGIRRIFSRKYLSFSEALNSPSRDEEDIQRKFDELIEVGVNNHHEYSSLNLAKYFNATLHGTPYEKMVYLERALNYTSHVKNLETFLPEGYEKEVRRNLFTLQVSNNHFYEAVESYKIMQEKEDIEGINLHKSLFEQVLAIKENETSFPINSQLNGNDSWFVSLFKNDFYIDNIQGKINEIKLRCETKFVFFALDTELDYNIPDSWGDCSMEVIGESNTAFRLVQY